MKRLEEIKDLEPCPFCGVKLVPKVEVWRNPNTGFTGQNLVYSHPKTNCVLDFARYHFYADPWKIDAWNRRVPTNLDRR